jgi:hypothetical protein
VVLSPQVELWLAVVPNMPEAVGSEAKAFIRVTNREKFFV